MNLDLKVFEKFRNNISINTKLSNYSWFNLGGPAEYFFRPESREQLLEFFKLNLEIKRKITILGAGSNTLIRDKGINGVVIKLSPSFSKIELIDKDTIQAGASAMDRKISNFAKDNGIGDFEFLSCIPGSIGGGVIMNSGCYGDDISKILTSINVIDMKKCEEREISKQDIKFFYRGTNLPEKYIITSVKLKGKIKPKDQIEKKQKHFIDKKKLSQPNQIKTCGSTFKNIEGKKKAWQLIKEAGCNKFKVGDASISEKHSNFFVNNGKAKSSDIEKLIQKVKQQVNNRSGVNLELEIKIVGE